MILSNIRVVRRKRWRKNQMRRRVERAQVKNTILLIVNLSNIYNFDRTGNLRKFAPRLEEIEEEEGKREEERKIINSSVEEEEDEDQEGSRKRMMGSFHSSASSGSSTLDMMGRVVRDGSSKEERRSRSKHQVTTSFISHFTSLLLPPLYTICVFLRVLTLA